MIKALLFDFGQTLVDSAHAFRAAEKEAQAKLFSHMVSHPERPSQEDFLSRYRSIRKEFHQQSKFSRQAIWRSVCQYFHHEPDQKLIEIWEHDYWVQVGARTNPFPETTQVLEALSPRYQLALVTNTQGQKSPGKHRLALFPQLESFFQVIVVAGESGIPPKPDIAPFHLCLKKLNVRPNEAVFVGDDWRIDICGAKNAGIQPVWLQHQTVKRNWPDVEIDFPVISRLDSLFDVLDVLQKSITPVILPEGYNGKILMIRIVGGKANGLVCLRAGDEWHREILRNTEQEIQALGFENSIVEPVGGAWVHFQEDGSIRVYGSSDEYGTCDKKAAADLISGAFPGRKVLIRRC
jgi:HAD superfamily hydrolase (TIGR01549 family)